MATNNVWNAEYISAGTFTPTLTFSNGNTGITYASQVGNYILVGTFLWLSLKIQLTSKGSSTGVVRIVTGLPFFRFDSNTNRDVLLLENTTLVGVPSCLLLSTGIIFSAVMSQSAGAIVSVNNTHISDTSIISLTFGGHVQ
jgi:hypothetical protein